MFNYDFINESRTTYTILAYSFASFFFRLNLGNSEMITSNHNTTQPKWNIWLLNHQHSTEGTGDSFNNRISDDTEWEETFSGCIRSGLCARLDWSVSASHSILPPAEATDISIYCTWSNQNTSGSYVTGKHTQQLTISTSKFHFKKGKKSKAWIYF